MTRLEALIKKASVVARVLDVYTRYSGDGPTVRVAFEPAERGDPWVARVALRGGHTDARGRTDEEAVGSLLGTLIHEARQALGDLEKGVTEAKQRLAMVDAIVLEVPPPGEER